MKTEKTTLELLNELIAALTKLNALWDEIEKDNEKTLLWMAFKLLEEMDKKLNKGQWQNYSLQLYSDLSGRILLGNESVYVFDTPKELLSFIQEETKNECY